MGRDALSIGIVHETVQSAAMTDSTFLPIREAADLAGVSKKTIERAIKRHFLENNLTAETAGDIFQVREKGSRKLHFIADSFIRTTLPNIHVELGVPQG